MRALQATTTTLITIFVSVILVYFAGKLPSGTASLVASAIAVTLVFLTLTAFYVPPNAVTGVYGLGMRFLRFFIWVLHLLIFGLFVFVALHRGPIWGLALALPSFLVLVTLFQTGKRPRLRQAAIKKAKAEKKKQQQTLLSTDPDLAVIEMRIYYAMHQAEIDAMLQTFRTLLVEKHGMREDFVKTIKRSQAEKEDLPISIEWHMRGTTAEEEAQKMCDVLYFSEHANNPAIFAKHMTTGEDLPADYEYDHWATRNLGHSTGQRVMMIGIFAALGCSLYTIYGQVTFVASGLWQQLTIGISLALTLAFLVQSLKRFQRGDIRTQPGRRKLKKWDLFWLMPFCAVFCWFMIGGGVGATLTAAFGTTHEAAYAYKKIPGKNCVTVEEGFPVLSRFCVPAASFQRMEKEGRVFFKGKKTWFGVVLDKVAVAS